MDVPRGQKAVPVSPCISSSVCHQDPEDQQGANTSQLTLRSNLGSSSPWPAAAVATHGTGTQDKRWGQLRAQHGGEGSPALPSTLRPLTMWRSNSASKGTVPRSQTSCWVTNHAGETVNWRLVWIYSLGLLFFLIMVMTHFLPTGAKGWL